MVQQGQIIKNRSSECLLDCQDRDLVPVLSALTATVSASLIRDAGQDDVYLSAREMRSLFNGDRVIASRNGVAPTARPARAGHRGSGAAGNRGCRATRARKRWFRWSCPDNPNQTQHLHRFRIGQDRRRETRPVRRCAHHRLPIRVDHQADRRDWSCWASPVSVALPAELAIHAHNFDSASLAGRSDREADAFKTLMYRQRPSAAVRTSATSRWSRSMAKMREISTMPFSPNANRQGVSSGCCHRGCRCTTSVPGAPLDTEAQARHLGLLSRPRRSDAAGALSNGLVFPKAEGRSAGTGL